MDATERSALFVVQVAFPVAENSVGAMSYYIMTLSSICTFESFFALDVQTCTDVMHAQERADTLT